MMNPSKRNGPTMRVGTMMQSMMNFFISGPRKFEGRLERLHLAVAIAAEPS